MDHKMHRALGEIQHGIKRREHNRRKRTEGVTVTPRKTPPPEPHDPYHRSDEQIAAYREHAKSQFPDN
jgi:hypothetical protein